MGCEAVGGMTELDIYDELPDAASGSGGGGGGSASSSSGATGATGSGGGGGGLGGGGGSCTSVNACTIEEADVDQCGLNQAVEILHNEAGGSPFLPRCTTLKKYQTVKFGLAHVSYKCTLRGRSPGKIDPKSPIETSTNGNGLLLETIPKEIQLFEFSECTLTFFCEEDGENAQGAIFFVSSCPP